MAGRKPGTPKTGGRVAGTQNKVTIELRERFKDFVDNNFPKIQGWLDRVAETDPDKALNLYMQFSERIIGKVQNTNVDVTSNGQTLIAPTIYVDGSHPEAGD